jgi:hypothetical protein
MGRHPWEIHPALERAKLQVLATILWRSRDEAAKDMKPCWSKGLTRWGLGCVAFQYSLAAIQRAELSGAYPWLRVSDRSSHFIFLINGVPIRFYRGDNEHDAPERHAEGSLEELAQLELTLADEAEAIDGVLRLIVATTAQGHPTGVFFARVTKDGKLHDDWRVPSLKPSAVNVAFDYEVAARRLLSQQPAATMDAPAVVNKKKQVEDQDAARRKAKDA